MPMYEYHCYGCKAITEELRKMDDSSLVECYICNQPMKKVIWTAPLMRMGTLNKNGQWVGDSEKELKKFKRKK